jgi:RNA polymerase-binding transcription factor DksA
MNKRNTEKLFNDFPRLFKGKDLGMRENLMCFGFECGDGWFGLIYQLSKDLEVEFQKLPETEKQEAIENDHYIAMQVKEKFGGLRFYMSIETKEMGRLISEAEDKSYTICESCGNPGEVRRGGWVQTLCDVCVSPKEEQNENT